MAGRRQAFRCAHAYNGSLPGPGHHVRGSQVTEGSGKPCQVPGIDGGVRDPRFARASWLRADSERVRSKRRARASDASMASSGGASLIGLSVIDAPRRSAARQGQAEIRSAGAPILKCIPSRQIPAQPAMLARAVQGTDQVQKLGAPGRIRTRDPLLRRQPLYPSELLALGDHCARPRSHIGHAEVAVHQGSDPGQYTERSWDLASLMTLGHPGRLREKLPLPTGNAGRSQALAPRRRRWSRDGPAAGAAATRKAVGVTAYPGLG